jgi:hypothetical protein
MNNTQINANDTQATDSSKQTYQTPTLEPPGPWTIPLGDCVTSPQSC